MTSATGEWSDDYRRGRVDGLEQARVEALAFIRVCSCGMSQVSIRAPLDAEMERMARRVAIADVNLSLCADEANRLRAEVERLRKVLGYAWFDERTDRYVVAVDDLRAALEEPTP